MLHTSCHCNFMKMFMQNVLSIQNEWTSTFSFHTFMFRCSFICTFSGNSRMTCLWPFFAGMSLIFEQNSGYDGLWFPVLAHDFVCLCLPKIINMSIFCSTSSRFKWLKLNQSYLEIYFVLQKKATFGVRW